MLQVWRIKIAIFIRLFYGKIDMGLFFGSMEEKKNH